MTDSIVSLQTISGVWRASEGLHLHQSRTPTGFTHLDTALGGGFPQQGLVRIRSLTGIGELTFLTRILEQHHSQRLVAFIQPPGLISQSWLSQCKLTPEQTLIIYPDSVIDSLWAAEQCIKSEACHSVVIWASQISPKQARRLQVAATQHQVLCVMYESQLCLRQALPVTLDLEIHRQADQLNIDITKQTGSWPGCHAAIHLAHTPTNQAIYHVMSQYAGQPEHNHRVI
ncbi:translesion DNA synthesis-associated protein ImuA [Salinimonas lutimaris]|uniref:translesion DNA synthesis-associated protein ImuA n=1 Tax=Salinimonas lutimaris TaxID=914153 RepID=UPI0010C0E66D|nr:translesion DNA synthesis-associated protein ImuA [Salinimonas lutimaris]